MYESDGSLLSSLPWHGYHTAPHFLVPSQVSCLSLLPSSALHGARLSHGRAAFEQGAGNQRAQRCNHQDSKGTRSCWHHTYALPLPCGSPSLLARTFVVIARARITVFSTESSTELIREALQYKASVSVRAFPLPSLRIGAIKASATTCVLAISTVRFQRARVLRTILKII